MSMTLFDITQSFFAKFFVLFLKKHLLCNRITEQVHIKIFFIFQEMNEASTSVFQDFDEQKAAYLQSFHH